MVRVDLGVALGADGETEAAVLAELGEHVVEERDAGLHLDRAGAVEVELDQQLVSLVSRDTRPTRAARGNLATSTTAPPASTSDNAIVERGGLFRGPDRDAQPARRAGVADQHASVEQALPDRVAGHRTRRTGRS